MSDQRPSPKTASSEELRLMWRMAGLAVQFGTEIIAGVLLGWGFDKLFGTRPWGVMIGSLAGIAVGTLDLTRKAIQLNRQMDAESRSPLDLAGKRTAGNARRQNRSQEVAHGEQQERDDSHEAWKDARDKELSSNDEDGERDKQHGS